MRVNYIFGSGGHARVLASVVGKPTTFVVQTPKNEHELSEDVFFGKIDEVGNGKIYIGIGENAIRRKIFDKLTAARVNVANCISHHSVVAEGATLGQGVCVLHGAIVGANAKIGDNTIINTLSSVDHDCLLGAHSQVTAGVTFGGGVTTGTNCFFGMRSTILPGRTLGDNVVVMAGALVTKDFPANVVVGGSPARVLKAVD